MTIFASLTFSFSGPAPRHRLPHILQCRAQFVMLRAFSHESPSRLPIQEFAEQPNIWISHIF